MRQLPVTMRRSEEFDGVSDRIPTVVIAVQIHGPFDHRFDCWTSASYLRSRLRLKLPQRSRSAQSSNNRFERSRVASSVAKDGVDDRDKSASLVVGATSRRSTSSLVAMRDARIFVWKPAAALGARLARGWRQWLRHGLPSTVESGSLRWTSRLGRVEGAP
jgi:hypothetical protein